jgi:hypothetical protein
LSVNPKIAAGAVAASVLIAVVVVCWSLWQTPTYEASALLAGFLAGEGLRRSYRPGLLP